jgi:peroxiredoxin Q/BCP
MINEGQAAPSFTLPNADGTPVSLSRFKGKNVVLYFYPKDDTPGCTREAIEFTQKKAEFAGKNTVILGVSKDSVQSHQKFCTKYTLTIDVLSDPNLDVIKAYDVWQEKTLYGKTSLGIVRSTFLIDTNGIIKKIWRNVRVEGHVDAILETLS